MPVNYTSVVAPALATLLFLSIMLSTAYASPAENPAVSVDIGSTHIDVTNAWQTHYAVNGFVNTGPADPYQVFKIHYRVINGTVEQFRMPYERYAHNVYTNVTSDGAGMLQIRFSRNYPNSNDGLGGEAIAFINGQEIFPEHTESECFSEFSLAFSNDAAIDVVWSFYDDSFRGANVPKSCIPETLVPDVVKKNGVIAPLHQIKAGVKPEEVVCGDDLETIMHPNGKPYCATSASAEILKERWAMVGIAKADKTTVTVDVGDVPQEDLIQSGMGTSLMTTYLPVNITHTIRLPHSIENLTLYPINADWDGIIRGSGKSIMVDENNNPVPSEGFGTLSLRGVYATCTEPYFVEVKETDAGEDGPKIEQTAKPVTSAIYWGDTFHIYFNEPQSGTISYTIGSYGIVPEDYNNKSDATYRTNGAGNQDISGQYHLSFVSFYPATVNLPKQAQMISSTEVLCSINEESNDISTSDFAKIYVYDVWFKLEE